MKFFTSKIKKLSPMAQKGLFPRKEFIERGKERFLAVYDASEIAHGATANPVRPAYGAMFFKIGLGVMVVLCVAVGASAYADTANVPPTSLFYPLKRLSENVQLALTPAPEKAQLQATFAVQRANEIEKLQASSPTSTLIPKLTRDLNKDISSSLSVVVGNGNNEHVRGNGNGGENIGAHATSSASMPMVSSSISSISKTEDTGSINVYCSAFNANTSGILIGYLESNLALHPGALAQFNKQCGDTKSLPPHQ
jgi:hypothetical protein